MSKLPALFIFSTIFLFNLYLNESMSKETFAVVASTATPTPNVPEDSFRMELDRNIFVIPCPPGYRCLRSFDGSSAPIVVTVLTDKQENNSFRYKYTTSGGRVVGEGAKVSWDLMGGQPGTYQITVVIEDKSGIERQTITKAITVINYRDDGDRCLSCPALSIDAPPISIRAGETMTFAANVSGTSDSEMTYRWKVTGGKIIEGQGTPVIKVATNSKIAGKIVEATAEFKWDCSEVCINTASASGSVIAKKRKRN